jgi:hypothetical protein
VPQDKERRPPNSNTAGRHPVRCMSGSTTVRLLFSSVIIWTWIVLQGYLPTQPPVSETKGTPWTLQERGRLKGMQFNQKNSTYSRNKLFSSHKFPTVLNNLSNGLYYQFLSFVISMLLILQICTYSPIHTLTNTRIALITHILKTIGYVFNYHMYLPQQHLRSFAFRRCFIKPWPD